MSCIYIHIYKYIYKYKVLKYVEIYIQKSVV